MNTPIDAKADGIVSRDAVLYKLMGLLCIVFGTFVLLLVCIPQPDWIKRFGFVFSGGVMLISGLILYSRSRSERSTEQLANNGPIEPVETLK